MKKKFLILLMAMFGITLQSKAQFVKYVRVTTDNVNLRKTPSASSAKLMESWDEGEHSFSWGNGDVASHPTQNEVLAVVEEAGEWLKILRNGGVCESGKCSKEYAYIMAKFCEEVHPIATTPQMYNQYLEEKGETSLRVSYRTSGKYEGFIITKFYPCSEGDQDGLRIGQCKDGKLIFTNSIEMYYGDETDKLTDTDIDTIFGQVLNQKSKYTTIIFTTKEGAWAEICL